MHQLKDCIICGKPFVPAKPTSSCCSDVCYAQNRRNKNRDKAALEAKEKWANADPNDYVECAICGVRMAEITRHVRTEHGLSSKEYRDKFGVATKCQRIIDGMSGENNPGYQHGGKLSPFSKKFVGYDGLTEVEMESKIRETGVSAQETAKENNTSQLHIGYYTSRGYSLEEAQIALSERQSTFSLEKCIEKFGEIEGRIRWQERQDTWRSSLDSKSQDEKDEIDRKKAPKYFFREYGSENMPGLFYAFRFGNGKIKFGISTKSTVRDRYSLAIPESDILFNTRLPAIKTAFMIEQVIKELFVGYTKKADNGNYGWTEVLNDVNEARFKEAVRLLIEKPDFLIEQFNEIQ